MKPRVILAVSVAIASAATAVAIRTTDPPTRLGAEERARLADASVGHWMALSGRAEEVDSVLAAIDTMVRARSADLEWGGRDPSPAFDDLAAVLAAWACSDAARLVDPRERRGLILDRGAAQSSISNAMEWGYLDDSWRDGVDERSDIELMSRFLEAQEKSGMTIDLVDVSSIEVGLGVSAVMNSTEWPHAGMEFSRSCYRSTEGFVSNAEMLEDTPDSLHVRLRVRFVDGRIGHVRFLYLFDTAAGAWVPIGAVNGTFTRGEKAMWCFAM